MAQDIKTNGDSVHLKEEDNSGQFEACRCFA